MIGKSADLKNPVADIGELFEYRDNKYRVAAWLKDPPEPEPFTGNFEFLNELMNEFKKESEERGEKRYQFCSREEAQYIEGHGIAGCIAPIDKIKRIGYYVNWPKKHIQEAIEDFKVLIGRIF